MLQPSASQIGRSPEQGNYTAASRFVTTGLALVSALVLSSCGGSGGGGGDSAGPGGGPPPVVGPTPPVSGAPIAPMTAANAGPISGTFMQFVDLTRVYIEELRSDVTRNVAVGTSSGACDSGGTWTKTLSANGLELTEAYSACALDDSGVPFEINGRLITEYSVAPSESGFTATKTFDGFEITGSGGVTELAKGTFVYESGPQQGLDSTDRIVFDMSIESSLEGTVRLTQVVLNIENSLDFLNGLVGITGVSGILAHDEAGGFNLAFDSAEGRVEFAGTGPEIARLEILSGRYYTTYHRDAAAPAEYVGRIDTDDLREISFFDDSIQYGPIQRSQLILDLEDYRGTNLVNPDELVSFSLRDNFWDRNGDVLAIGLELVSITADPREGPDIDWDPVAAQDEYSIGASESGLFEFESTLDDEIVTYQFEAHATDPGDLRTTAPLEFSIAVYRDSDSDDTADRFDTDDDNDGIADTLDRFPLDPSEWDDTDQDGVGNNADTDDDNDGVLDADDFYPLDARCFAETDGDGVVCWLTELSTNTDAIIDSDGIVYLSRFEAFFHGRHTVRRYDTNTNQFLDPFDLDPVAFGLVADESDYEMRYVSSHHALYVTYTQGLVTKIDLTNLQAGESLVHTRDVRGLSTSWPFDYSPYLMVFDQYPLREITHYSYDNNGVFVDSLNQIDDFNVPSISLPENAAICQEGFTLSRSDGLFFEFSNADGFDCTIFGEPQPAPDGLSFLTFFGEIVDADLNVLATMPFPQPGSGVWRYHWTDDGIYVPVVDGVDLYSPDGTLLATHREPEARVAANSRRIIRGGSVVGVVWVYSDGLRITRFDPPQP